MSPTNLMVPFLCPATITLSPTSISASDDMEDVRDLLKPEKSGFAFNKDYKEGTDGMANIVDPDQTMSNLIWVFTVCSGLCVPILRTFMVT